MSRWPRRPTMICDMLHAPPFHLTARHPPCHHSPRHPASKCATFSVPEEIAHPLALKSRATHTRPLPRAARPLNGSDGLLRCLDILLALIHARPARLLPSLLLPSSPSLLFSSPLFFSPPFFPYPFLTSSWPTPATWSGRGPAARCPS